MDEHMPPPAEFFTDLFYLLIVWMVVGMIWAVVSVIWEKIDTALTDRRRGQWAREAAEAERRSER